MKKEIKIFEFRGTHQEKGETHSFTKTITAPTENFALEKLLSQIGSKHGAQRRHIVVQEMKELKKEESK